MFEEDTPKKKDHMKECMNKYQKKDFQNISEKDKQKKREYQKSRYENISEED